MVLQSRKRVEKSSEAGETLIETLIAATICIVLVAGVLSLFPVVFSQNETQGDLATRTTEYSQDKMEELLSLSFNDGATNTTVYPPTSTGGTGLGGTMAASTTVGAVPPSAAVSGYVDYLDYSGNLLTSSTGAEYTRQWSISTDSTATLKTITAVTTSIVSQGPQGAAPSCVLVCIKSSGL
jgi:Tfp pilus assembly protein PilV